MNRKTAPGFIAYFDILGFKRIVKDVPSEKLDRLYSHLITAAQWAIADDGIPLDNVTVVPVFRNGIIKAVNVSDSIVFFSEDDTKESLMAILKAVAKFIPAMECYCSFRGSLVLGKYNYVLGTVLNENGEAAYNVSAIYGQALIDAYQKAEALEWTGFFIDATVTALFGKDANSLEIFEAYIEFPVPFKNGKWENLLAFKFTLSDSNGKSHEEQVRNLFEMNGLMFSKEVRVKYRNTLAFRKYCNHLVNGGLIRYKRPSKFCILFEEMCDHLRD